MREPHKGLASAYTGVPHDPRDFDAAYAFDREKHLFDLGAPQLFGRVHEQVVDVQPSALEVTLGRGPGEAYPVGLLERVPAFVSRPFWCPPQHQRVSISSPEGTRSNLSAGRQCASFGGTSWSCGGCHTSPWRTTCPCDSWSGRSTPNGSPRRRRSSSASNSPWRPQPQRRRGSCLAHPLPHPPRSRVRASNLHQSGPRAATPQRFDQPRPTTLDPSWRRPLNAMRLAAVQPVGDPP